MHFRLRCLSQLSLSIAAHFIFLVFPCAHVSAAPWSDIVSPTRAIDWSRAGVEGGIPSASWTQCGATLPAGSSVVTIQNAINACDVNQFVQLAAGTFTLTSGLNMKSRIALRGMGSNQTFLIFTGDTPCAGAYPTVCFAGGDSTNYSGAAKTQPGGSNAANWTGGYGRGSSQITLANIGSSGIREQQIIYLDQENDRSPTSGLMICEETSASPPCSDEGGKGNPGRIVNNVARQQVQIVRVTQINGNSYTISPPLHAPNWSADKSPGAWWSSNVIEFSGLEDLSMDATNSGSLSNIAMYNGANLWIKGTRQIRSCQCNRATVRLAPAAHVTIQDNYFYGTSGHSQNYGIEGYIASENLIVNNIFQHTASPMMLHTVEGSVYAYNFAINDTYDDGRSPQYHWMSSAFGGHSGGVLYNLFEGNIVPGVAADVIHGSQGMGTFFAIIFLGAIREELMRYMQLRSRRTIVTTMLLVMCLAPQALQPRTPRPVIASRQFTRSAAEGAQQQLMPTSLTIQKLNRHYFAGEITTW